MGERYHGRADLEKRIKELGEQFGIKRLHVQNFWDTEALPPLARAAHTPVHAVATAAGTVGEVRGEHAALAALRAGDRVEPSRQQTHAQKLAVRGEANRHWWRKMLSKLTAPATATPWPPAEPERGKLSPSMRAQLNRCG